MSIGKSLAALRREHGLTQTKLAQKLGRDPQTISRWERDVTSPDALEIEALAKAIGCDVADIFATKKGRGK